VTFPLRADLSSETVKTLRRLLDQAFWEADQGCQQSEPGSYQEAEWMAQRHAIEELQKVLR
jgi:hypothetical protein